VRTDQSRRHHGQGPEIAAFSAAHGFPIVTVADLAAYRQAIGDRW